MDEIAAGGSSAAIARREGLRHQTLLWWKWRLGHERREVGTKPARARAPKQLATFLRVEEASVHPAACVVEVTLELAEVTLRVPVGVEPRYVAALVGALRTPC